MVHQVDKRSVNSVLLIHSFSLVLAIKAQSLEPEYAV